MKTRVAAFDRWGKLTADPGIAYYALLGSGEEASEVCRVYRDYGESPDDCRVRAERLAVLIDIGYREVTA